MRAAVSQGLAIKTAILEVLHCPYVGHTLVELLIYVALYLGSVALRGLKSMKWNGVG